MAYRCARGLARLAACIGLVVAPPALADDEVESDERSPSSIVLFASMEAGPTKSFATIGMKRAWGGAGLDASGFRTMVKLGVAREQAQDRPPHGTAYKSEAQSLVGYEWRIGETFVALYGGADYEVEQRPCGCGLFVTTARIGQRLQADLWARPLPEMMLQGAAYASTLDRRLWARLAAGWTLPQDFLQQDWLPQSWLSQPVYLGPELEAFRQRDYVKLRLGLHVTGIRLMGLTWRFSGGWQHTSDRPAEAYATLGLHWRR